MCNNCVALGILLIVVLVWIFVRREHMETMEDIPISKMSADDIDKLRQYIERAVRVGQFYGDFRRMYPYEITPWQYNTMIAKRKLGQLDNETVKNILRQSGEQVMV